ncbi:hypothetical protein IDH44_21400 [Paenibacillus sp. IB182496]|uniref:Uncharacterized protein n=1 Tax=Paenibacillus sabuli TaxID=2772509 RepID=A0A927GUJ0_9BACL|nr:hypothetical protein [Paenibacillus sabuli]
MNGREERLLTPHEQRRWRRRREELEQWLQRDKVRVRGKRLVQWRELTVDHELLPALTELRRKGVETEYSCAGVSALDEPLEHSLYAYVTIHASEAADRYVELAIARMRHRLCATYDPQRRIYDLSSMHVGYNRSFCTLLYRCARLLPH